MWLKYSDTLLNVKTSQMAMFLCAYRPDLVMLCALVLLDKLE